MATNSLPVLPINETGDAYARLRTAIVTGHFSPNERLVELTLAAELGAGRAAIRAAIARLAQEGLVVHEPNRGAHVRAISLADAVDLYEVREVLEGLAARRAAQHITRAEMTALRAVLKAMQRCFDAGDLLGMSDLNAQLHGDILRIANQPALKQMIDGLRAQHVRFQYRTVLVPGRAEQSLQEHRQIVAALTAKDGPAAEVAMRKHLANVVSALQQSISRNGYSGAL